MKTIQQGETMSPTRKERAPCALAAASIRRNCNAILASVGGAMLVFFLRMAQAADTSYSWYNLTMLKMSSLVGISVLMALPLLASAQTSCFVTTNIPDIFFTNGELIFDQVNEGDWYVNDPITEHYGPDHVRFAGKSAVRVLARRTAGIFPGLQNALQINVVQAKSASSNDDDDHIEFPVESPFIVPLLLGTPQAQAFTISFQAASNIPGDFSFAIMDGRNTVSYVTTYTIPTPNQVYAFHITVPPATMGVWQSAPATFGLKVLFDLGVGPHFTTSQTNSWQPIPRWKAPGTVSLTEHQGGVFYLGGLQTDVGTVAQPFRHIDYATQLKQVQRYFWKSLPQGTKVGNGAGTAGAIQYITNTATMNIGTGFPQKFPVEMASTPSAIATFNPVSQNALWYDATQRADSGAASFSDLSSAGVTILNPQTPSTQFGNLLQIQASADARLGGR